MAGGHEEVAKAISRHVSRAIGEQVNQLELGVVRVTTPSIEVELLESHQTLTEGDDFTLTQFLSWWDTNYAIQPDDVLVMMQHESGQRIAFDVTTDRPFEAGVRMNRPPASAGGDVRPLQTRSESGLFTVNATTGAVTWAHHIVAGMPVYDKDGAFIGYVPVFGSLPA